MKVKNAQLIVENFLLQMKEDRFFTKDGSKKFLLWRKLRFSFGGHFFLEKLSLKNVATMPEEPSETIRKSG
jgi:hypothetical protein